MSTNQNTAQRILESSSMVAFVWRNEARWPVEFVTHNVEQLFGYSASDFLDQKIEYSKVIHPDDLSRVSAEVLTASANRAIKRFEHEPYRIIHADGEIRWVKDVTSIRRNSEGEALSFEGVIFDITELISTQKELELIKVAVDQSSEGVVMADAEGRHLYQNKVFSRLLGYSLEEATKTDPIEYHKDKEKAEKIFEACKAGRSWHGELDMLAKDGRTIPFELRATGVKDKNENVICLLGTLRDITQRREIYAQIKEKQEFIDTVLGYLPLGVLVVDAENYKILFANQECTRLLKCKSSEIVSKYCYEVFCPEAENEASSSQ
jgi:PAS domain S-box-containing protein